VAEGNRQDRVTGTGADAPPYLVSAEEAVSLHGLLCARVARTPDAIAYREHNNGSWHPFTWRETMEGVRRYQAALHRCGVAPGDRVALRAKNGVPWVLFEQAALALGCVLVPLYVMDRAENVAWVLGNAGARVLMVDDADMWEELLPHRHLAPDLETVVVHDDKADLSPGAVSISTWLDGAGAPPDPHHAEPDDLATIIYTSGTTGRPKGVMLSHRNILDNCFHGQRRLPISPEERLLSFLPLCHALERTCGYYVPMMAGASVAFARSVSDLPEDLLTIQPTCIITVPRIFERLHRRVLDALAQGTAVKRLLFDAAVNVGWSRFLRRQGRGPWRASHLLGPILDQLVGRKIRSRLGGQLQGALCGGAALRFDIARMLVATGVEISHSYGLTECSPGVSVNGPEGNRPDTVGPPVPESTVRIASDGELCVRSTSVMLGYWRNEEATRKVIDDEGWLHTGDLARLDDGYVVITGRKKEIIVLATGTKVPPGDIEEAILNDPLFEQVLLVGEGRPYLSVLAFVDSRTWRRKARGQLPDDATAGGPEVERFLLERVATRLAGFTGHARVHRIAVVPAPWTVESGLLTPTLKPRRRRIEEAHAEEIQRMYEETCTA